jgi:hypothetical protein
MQETDGSTSQHLEIPINTQNPEEKLEFYVFYSTKADGYEKKLLSDKLVSVIFGPCALETVTSSRDEYNVILSKKSGAIYNVDWKYTTAESGKDDEAY